MELTASFFENQVDLDRVRGHVQAVVEAAIDGSVDDITQFLGRYIEWNATFGAGVACLASKIGRNTHLFIDPDEKIEMCADRSSHVASYFFDAARDEYDDSATPHRDTHRTLAQAVIKGIARFGNLSADKVNSLTRSPPWLEALCEDTARGYGLRSPDDLAGSYRAIGFHLGSELLADAEFTRIDQALREKQPELVKSLLSNRVFVAGHPHAAYYWVGIHSGLGGGVEADHFDAAAEGARQALRFTPEADQAASMEHLVAGFHEFARCHRAFFDQVST